MLVVAILLFLSDNLTRNVLVLVRVTNYILDIPYVYLNKFVIINSILVTPALIWSNIEEIFMVNFPITPYDGSKVMCSLIGGSDSNIFKLNYVIQIEALFNMFEFAITRTGRLWKKFKFSFEIFFNNAYISKKENSAIPEINGGLGTILIYLRDLQAIGRNILRSCMNVSLMKNQSLISIYIVPKAKLNDRWNLSPYRIVFARLTRLSHRTRGPTVAVLHFETLLLNMVIAYNNRKSVANRWRGEDQIGLAGIFLHCSKCSMSSDIRSVFEDFREDLNNIIKSVIKIKSVNGCKSVYI
jgi:hypothetical protein